MKYLYQQMLAFWAIIILIMVVVGLSFTSFTKKTILDSMYEQMFGYADSVLENSQDDPTTILANVKNTEVVLHNQGVRLFYISDDQTIVYPDWLEGTIGNSFMTDDQWQRLKQGERVKADMEVPYNRSKTRNMAIVLQPFFLWEDKPTFIGALAVMQPVSNLEANMDLLTENLFKGFLISSVIALGFSYVLAQFQVNRINRMKKATKQISEGNFDVYLEVKGQDELDELAEDFNQMATTLKASHQEIERQEERRRQFMADAAHEMRTPLTTINGLLEGMAYQAIPKDQEAKSIELMRKETKRLIRLVNENLDYEKIRTNQISMVIQKMNATEIVRNVLTQLENKASENGNKLQLTSPESVEVYADYDRFVQIMVNLLQNAIQFTTDGVISVVLSEDDEQTKIVISDTGIGMSEEELANIWERYYKVDPSRKNTKYGESGLGLSIVQQLMKLHHGTIDVTSTQGEGTCFTLLFPKQLKEEKETE
ncbi:HAMP domain-containing sensor histidine kinase [Vagococcus lutrae]|uniref:histidine kinase n=1 Tax=Vagococcus lutrae TaxID=81947 RepID=A0AAE9XM09_9ENTE|nr:HAMP domain-containing sensor histidine kinase [Vagococcus lutrae]WCG23260.1 HAMP domain-containing sensor histidine kinase [Vagococcus lutrae]